MPKSVFTEEYAALLATLVSARKAAHMTQAELSARIGRPQPFISYVERGERRVDVVEFYAIALALGRDPIDLFTEVVGKFAKGGNPSV